MRPRGRWIGVVLLFTAAGADRTGVARGAGTGPADSVKDARALTARIDAVLAARWAQANVTPAVIAADGEFLRRVSLDLIGKIPTAAEARDFLDDPSNDKRLALVERLLDSPAYTTRATEILRQFLLPEADTDDVARQFAGGFEAWLKRKVIEEAGYDRIVREVLTAKLNSQNADAPLVGRIEPSPAAYFDAKGASPKTSRRACPAFSWEFAWNALNATNIPLRPGSGNNSGASPRSSLTLRPTRPRMGSARGETRIAARSGS